MAVAVRTVATAHQGAQHNSGGTMPSTSTPATARIIRNDDKRGNYLTEAERYPKGGTHTWGAFAGLAIEFEGYNDAMVIDPWSGDQLYVPNLPDLADLSGVLRAIAAAVEVTGFGTEH